MTIKEHGGVFGRNPTFNTVTASQFVGPISGLATSAAALKSSATTGLMQITGPAAGQTRTMTIPDANFTAARTDAAQAFTGNQTLTDGNLIVSDGKGIDFSATPGTGTSELFDDYEEGTWTPTVATDGADGTYTVTVNTATYTKVGNSVRVSCFITVNVTVAPTGALSVGGLPFNAAENTAFVDGHNSLSASTGQGYLVSGSPIMRFNQAGGTASVTMSAGTGNKFLMMSAVYRGA